MGNYYNDPDSQLAANRDTQNQVPALSSTMRLLSDEFSVWRNSLQKRMTSWIYKAYAVTQYPQQKKLVAMDEESAMEYFAEGVKRLYLGTRGGLPFYNNYCVLSQFDSEINYLDSIVRTINSVSYLVRTVPGYAEKFKMHRRASNLCDELELDANEGAEFFVLLYRGEIFSLPIGTADDVETLKNALTQILQINNSVPGFTLGECSALERERWCDIEHGIQNNPTVLHALELMRCAKFMICLDSFKRYGEENGADQIDAYNPLNSYWFHNRFFDKCIQVVVSPIGQIALVCEHAGLDGTDAVQILTKISENPSTDSNVRSFDSDIVHWRIDLVKYIGAGQVTFAKAYNTSSASDCKFGTCYYSDLTYEKLNQYDVSVDALVQIATQIAYARCTNRYPTVYEPVKPPAFTNRRLEFISPCSNEALLLNNALYASDEKRSFELLKSAVDKHRKSVKHVKNNGISLSHLLALGAVESPKDAAKGARSIRRKSFITSRLSKSFKYLMHRDLTVSCGGCSDQIVSFSTITHKPNMSAIGYVANKHGLSGTLLINGRANDVLNHIDFGREWETAINQILDCLSKGEEYAY